MNAQSWKGSKMAYERRTVVSGKNRSGKRVFGWLSGYWKLESAVRWARLQRAVGEVRIEHSVIDNSGKGRGGHDGRWVASADDKIERVEVGR